MTTNEVRKMDSVTSSISFGIGFGFESVSRALRYVNVTIYFLCRIVFIGLFGSKRPAEKVFKVGLTLIPPINLYQATKKTKLSFMGTSSATYGTSTLDVSTNVDTQTTVSTANMLVCLGNSCSYCTFC